MDRLESDELELEVHYAITRLVGEAGYSRETIQRVVDYAIESADLDVEDD